MPAKDSKLEAATESKSPLVQLFRRKLQVALQLTQDDVGRESERMYNVAYLPYPAELNEPPLSLQTALKRARLSSASKFRALEDVLLVPDADDPERSKAIEGRDLELRIYRALSYYRDALLARLKPLVRENFKPVAQVAAQLIAAGFEKEVEEVHGTTFWVIHDHKYNLDCIHALHRYYGRTDLTASFVLEFADMFTDLWCRLALQAELEAPSLPPTRSQTIPGDARSRALAGESSRGAVDEKRRGENEFRRRIICDAAEGGLEGPEYCSYLHEHGIQTPELWQRRGCPKSYPAAHKIKKWRKSVQQEKTRVVKESGNDAGSSKRATVH
jgi:hypothetical protein